MRSGEDERTWLEKRTGGDRKSKSQIVAEILKKGFALMDRKGWRERFLMKLYDEQITQGKDSLTVDGIARAIAPKSADLRIVKEEVAFLTRQGYIKAPFGGSVFLADEGIKFCEGFRSATPEVVERPILEDLDGQLTRISQCAFHGTLRNAG